MMSPTKLEKVRQSTSAQTKDQMQENITQCRLTMNLAFMTLQLDPRGGCGTSHAFPGRCCTSFPVKLR
jgi:hypothetical protein